MSGDTHTDEKIKEAVRESYGSIARKFVQERGPASCCGPSTAAVSTACCPSEEQDSCGQTVDSTCTGSRFYSVEELANLPTSVTDASLGCGNPIAIAELQPGEVVLDLGSGGGIDCFLAAKMVGEEGRVIGLDMTPDMIRLARRNAKEIGASNVEFRFGEMEDIPQPNESVDVIISNCVINLSPDKDAVFAEAYRVLKPGGRLSVSDIVVDGDLPSAIRQRLDAWAGCIAGALDEKVYLEKIQSAGFEQIDVVSREPWVPGEVLEASEPELVAIGADGQPIPDSENKAILKEADVSPQELAASVASVKVTAYKPL
jgi:SAM-dependent methyltransferase